jgi:hypothetical protein
MNNLVPLGIGAAILLASSSAEAAGPNNIHSARFEIHGNINPYILGAGFRAELPIVPDGIIRGASNVHDEFAVSLGADLWFASYYAGYHSGAYIIPVATIEWNFYIGDKWSIFPEIGIAFPIGFNGPDYDYHYWGGPARHGYYLWYAAGFGVRYHFSARNSLVFRIGSTSGFAIGVTF